MECCMRSFQADHGRRLPVRPSVRYSKDDDHIAQIIELMSEIPKSITFAGIYSSEFFNRKGQLRQINKLRYWPLDCVLHDKYVPFPKRRSRRDRLVPHPHAPPAPRQTRQGLRPCTPQLARRRLKSRGRLTLSAVRKKMRRGEDEGILSSAKR